MVNTEDARIVSKDVSWRTDSWLMAATLQPVPKVTPAFSFPPTDLENANLKVNRLTTRINIEDFEEAQG